MQRRIFIIDKKNQGHWIKVEDELDGTYTAIHPILGLIAEARSEGEAITKMRSLVNDAVSNQ